MSEEKKCCKNCKHFDSVHKEDMPVQRGRCRRMPPTPVVVDGKLRFYFPIVNEDCECGEHKPVPELIKG